MNRIVMMALLVVGGCATAPPPSSNNLLPPAPPSPDVRAAYAQANLILTSTQNMSSMADIAAAHADALSIYNRVLAMKPDFMDALNDKAWILATTPDPRLRQPKEGLQIAKQALDSLASTGMLRLNREAFADDHTTGRMLVAATTFAAALAANNVFGAANTELAATSTELAAADCPATADTVMDFVVESAANLDARFHTPSTAEMVKRATAYQASFRQRKPLVGDPPLLSLLAPATRLR